MDLANAIIGVALAGIASIFGYLLHHFVSDIKRQIRECEEQRERMAEVLVQMETDMNEVWYQVRQLNGMGGGRRKCRITKEWRKPGYVSRAWQDDFGEGSGGRQRKEARDRRVARGGEEE